MLLFGVHSRSYSEKAETVANFESSMIAYRPRREVVLEALVLNASIVFFFAYMEIAINQIGVHFFILSTSE